MSTSYAYMKDMVYLLALYNKAALLALYNKDALLILGFYSVKF